MFPLVQIIWSGSSRFEEVETTLPCQAMMFETGAQTLDYPRDWAAGVGLRLRRIQGLQDPEWSLELCSSLFVRELGWQECVPSVNCSRRRSWFGATREC